MLFPQDFLEFRKVDQLLTIPIVATRWALAYLREDRGHGTSGGPQDQASLTNTAGISLVYRLFVIPF